MRGAEHVEEKPIAAPVGPIARLAPGCRQNVLRHARSILYFSKDLPCRCGLGNLARAAGRREVPETAGVLRKFAPQDSPVKVDRENGEAVLPLD
jgi:hypothetical protein